MNTTNDDVDFFLEINAKNNELRFPTYYLNRH